MWVARQLIEHGEIVRSWININAVDLNPKIVAYYKLPTESGVMVTNVLPNSEAERPKLKPGDIIVRMADVKIDNVRDLIKVMNKHQVGDNVNVELFRGNEKMLLETVLEKAPSTKIPKIQGKQ
jgi:S1-C subfamily serine protease